MCQCYLAAITTKVIFLLYIIICTYLTTANASVVKRRNNVNTMMSVAVYSVHYRLKNSRKRDECIFSGASMPPAG